MQQHIHITGFARSGTTLMKNLMVCFHHTEVAPGEVKYEDVDHHVQCSGLGVGVENLVTKSPFDYVRANELCHIPNVKVIYMVRDPRDILCSINQATEEEEATPSFNPGSVLANIACLEELDPKVLLVKYEDIVTKPEEVQSFLERECGLVSRISFEEGYLEFPDEEQDYMQRAMNGIRSLDTDSIGRWKLPDYKEKVENIVKYHPKIEDFINSFYPEEE